MLEWLLWPFDLEKIEPRSRYAWLIAPLSVLLLVGTGAAFFFCG
jgi:hypothetical protein